MSKVVTLPYCSSTHIVKYMHVNENHDICYIHLSRVTVLVAILAVRRTFLIGLNQLKGSETPSIQDTSLLTCLPHATFCEANEIRLLVDWQVYCGLGPALIAFIWLSQFYNLNQSRSSSGQGIVLSLSNYVWAR